MAGIIDYLGPIVIALAGVFIAFVFVGWVRERFQARRRRWW